MPSSVSLWLAIAFMFEFALGTFLVFAARGVRWYYRATAAFFAIGFSIIFVAFLYYALSGRAAELPPFDLTTNVLLFVFVNVFGFKLVHYLANREEGFSCFGTIGKLLGCLVVGFGMCVLLVFGLGGSIGLLGQ